MSPFADLEQSREYQRKYQRERRLHAGKAPKKPTAKSVTASFRLESVRDIAGVLERITNELMDNDELDIILKGRVIASLMNTATKILEVGAIEERLQQLEEAQAEQRQESWQDAPL